MHQNFKQHISQVDRFYYSEIKIRVSVSDYFTENHTKTVFHKFGLIITTFSAGLTYQTDEAVI